MYSTILNKYTIFIAWDEKDVIFMVFCDIYAWKYMYDICII